MNCKRCGLRDEKTHPIAECVGVLKQTIFNMQASAKFGLEKQTVAKMRYWLEDINRIAEAVPAIPEVSSK